MTTLILKLCEKVTAEPSDLWQHFFILDTRKTTKKKKGIRSLNTHSTQRKFTDCRFEHRNDSLCYNDFKELSRDHDAATSEGRDQD